MNNLLKVLGGVALTLGIILESFMIWFCYIEKDLMIGSIKATEEIFKKES